MGLCAYDVNFRRNPLLQVAQAVGEWVIDFFWSDSVLRRAWHRSHLCNRGAGLTQCTWIVVASYGGPPRYQGVRTTNALDSA